MDLHQLRCFVAVAEELHFGRAAQRLGMLPSALGRHIRLLEEDLGTRLMTRTTRNVALTEDGASSSRKRETSSHADDLAARFRTRGRTGPDAAGRGDRQRCGRFGPAPPSRFPGAAARYRREPGRGQDNPPDSSSSLGRLDLAFLRPPESPDQRLEFLLLFHETAVVAVPAASARRCEHCRSRTLPTSR